ncbi:unnamed protein product [Cyberlindnera jadinii]|uniref:Uncharacterized protein n=1 Tax=Cyberlindnera jadinii (strain ATCC 18201 / CBS 1600 / BCRC 20928 / JCM 3617 / NBRC 0987 / NRRL Y-1542) TaxID=983966 RepID=A0A0H5C844_CYBJN|nr:unnamed protein product [Cyberlindnera jadinii]
MKVKSTKSTKRYTFASFKERVDAIKIEPSKKLNRRAFDDAETSHFLSTLERWVEFNRSANFTQFFEAVQPKCQSLPQLIHYRQFIFDQLCESLEKGDSLSLHPLTELLTQFCHDLGPDFMEFYEKTVTLITQMAIRENTSETLEWEFNCLGFIFKYLAKVLTEDLVPTFNLLEPLFHSKEHIARFSAEALSFLLRKTPQKELIKFTEVAFVNIETEDETYVKSIVTLFSESMKSTKGSIHSKFMIMTRSLFNNLNSDRSSSVLCDILLSVLNYGSPEAVEEVYSTIVTINRENLAKDKSYINHYIKVTTVLIFADSGKKIPDWSLITESIDNVIANIDLKTVDDSTCDLTVYLASIFFRNCEIQTLTKFHAKLLHFVSSLQSFFLPFIISILDLCKERTLKYSRSFVQDFINKSWTGNAEAIVFFIQNLEKRELITRNDDQTKFKLSIPSALTNSMLDELRKLSISNSDALYEVYWRLCILSYSSNLDSSVFVGLLDQLNDIQDQSEFKETVISKTISLLSLTGYDPTTEIVLNNFEKLHKNLIFMTCAYNYLKDHKLATADAEKLIALTSNNLITPNHALKTASLQLIRCLANGNDEELITIANQCEIIEQIPLTMANGRDIQLRMRTFAQSFSNLDTMEDLRSEVFLKYLLGMLSVRFSPSWQIVYEVLPSVLHKNRHVVWETLYNFVIGSYKDGQAVFYSGMEDDLIKCDDGWVIIDNRLNTIIGSFKKVISEYLNKEQSILTEVEESYKTEQYPEFMCLHAIAALKKIPELVEKNSKNIVALVLDNSLEDNEDSVSLMNKTERSALLELFVNFKKLKSIPRADELYQRLLTLLSSRTPEIRQISLQCLLNYKNPQVMKYKDTLTNLLDDAAFRDEIQKITSKGEDCVIEDKDEPSIMPLILRIIFGRAQNNNVSGAKKSLNFGAVTVLPQLSPKYVVDFLNIVSERVYNNDATMDFDTVEDDQLSLHMLKRYLGFTNLLGVLIKTLGEKCKEELKITIRPLLQSLVCAELVINSGSTERHVDVIARNIRSSGLKNLLALFDLLNEFSWDEYIEVIYEKVLAPRFVNFETENLQQASSLVKIIVCWSQYKSHLDLLLINDLEPSKKLLSLLPNPKAKPEVISIVLDFCTNIIKKVHNKTKYDGLTKLVSTQVFSSLETILSRITEPHMNAKIIDLLLALVENKYVEDQERRNSLVNVATQMLEKPSAQLSNESKLQVLRTLKALIEEFHGEFQQVQHLYQVSSKFLKFFTNREQRDVLIELFVEIGNKFEDYSRVANYLTELNSFSKRGLAEFDYDRRLDAFREINETTYQELTSLEWLPILNTSLFFLTEVDDLAIKTNASYTLRRFADAFSEKEEADKDMIRLFKDLILSNLRVGIRNKDEAVQTEFITVFAHYVSNIKHVGDFEDLKVLLFNNDDEANFFMNINHIQLHRRQRAIKRLGQVASEISGSNIAYYILPMIEHYAFVSDEKFRNISNETILTIEKLISCVTYKQFMAVFKRYMAGLKEGSETLRDSVNLIVTIAKALLKNVQRAESDESKRMEGIPSEHDILDVQLEQEMIEPLSKILNKRDEETIVFRTPLIEALSCLILCLSHDRIVIILPSVLTKICQILRSRSDELRDAVRKHLGRASRTLGPKYIKFIIKELKTALARGFQIHVLGFTVHSIVSSMEFSHGDLDESASLIMDIIMENTFGGTGQEKEADGYRTSMKEVKHNKSYDLGELLTRVISLSCFNFVVEPIKLLLEERITLKIQNKLDELLRRFSLGIYKNEDSTKQDMLVLCFELFKESEKDFTSHRREPTMKDSEKHFLVQLSSKSQRVVNENSVYVDTFQRLSLELLRTTLNKNPNFINAECLSGFIPFFEVALESENEAVITSALKILEKTIHVDFDSEGDIFKSAARKCLNIIKNFPSTESEIVQSCFKYLSVVIRHREELSLKESSLGYLLVKIQPDLSEQTCQALVFNFLRAVVSKRIMLPEVYEIMDKLREVMVTSHSKERRDMSRSIYFQFLMEYDQGRGRLEKQFKFLVNNLSYPSETGKQSVMELLHLIIQKCGPELLEALSSSFFVALSKVLISETSTKSREMAIALITSIFEKKGTEPFEKFIRGWMNSKNSALLKCSLQLYRIKVKVSGFEAGSELDNDVLLNIKETLHTSRSDSEVDVKWELVYTALTCLSHVVEKDVNVFDEELKADVISCLLFPHSWVRLTASRLLCVLLSKKRDFFSDADLQNVSYRVFHQLNAPSIDERLGSQAVKSLTIAMMRWEQNGTLFDNSLRLHSKDDESENEYDEEDTQSTEPEHKMSNWAIKRASAVVRSEKSDLAAKRAGVQFLAMCVQILDVVRLNEVAQDMILPLFTLVENETDDEAKTEVQNLALECMKLIEDKIGVSDYTGHYSKVNQLVLRRRQDRRTKRARLAITAPDKAARRKEKKHERSRIKRKHEKDENGFYHTKKKKHL